MATANESKVFDPLWIADWVTFIDDVGPNVELWSAVEWFRERGFEIVRFGGHSETVHPNQPDERRMRQVVDTL